MSQVTESLQASSMQSLGSEGPEGSNVTISQPNTHDLVKEIETKCIHAKSGGRWGLCPRQFFWIFRQILGWERDLRQF